jgi:beta-N-acetylhexosaminidase
MKRVTKLPLGAVMLDVEGLDLNPDDARRLQNPGVGGVILFSRNFEDREQVKKLIKEIRSLRDPELLIAVDQEGGRVQRFKNGFTLIPPMAVFGQLFDEAYDEAGEHAQRVLKLAASTAQLMAEELIECGVDFSFAPVLDLGLHGETIIGNRAFHADPEKLIAIASAFIEGMQAAGMQATGKHFPGHGHVLADSHLETPVDKRDFETILKTDTQPFIVLKDKLGAVMTAHIEFPDIDEALPTFSKYWLQDVLRKQLGFSGLIFSDDLTMHGALVGGSIVERADLAISAGCDMVLVCNDHAVMDELLAAKTMNASSESQQRFLSMKAHPATKLSATDRNQTIKQLTALA